MIVVVPDKELLAQTLADRFVASSRAAISERGRFTVALSGGKTPQPGFALLGQEPRCSQVDWSNVHVFWGDERNVPPSDKDSNEGMARDAFLDAVSIPAEQIHGIYMGGANEEAAAAYSALMHEYFPPNGPTFDLVMLGVGPDGHTASLFPGKAGLDTSDWVIPAETDDFAVKDRITLSAKPLTLGREVLFVVAGADKAGVLHEIIEGEGNYPSKFVANHSADVTWLLDKAAAANLS